MKDQGATHRGTNVDIPGMKKGKGQRTTLADLQAAQNERKQQGRKKREFDRAPERPRDMTDEDHEAMEYGT